MRKDGKVGLIAAGAVAVFAVIATAIFLAGTVPSTYSQSAEMGAVGVMAGSASGNWNAVGMAGMMQMMGIMSNSTLVSECIGMMGSVNGTHQHTM